MIGLSYDFLSLLHNTELLASRGHRLQETLAQRQGKVYGPDVFLKAEIEEVTQKLSTTFVEDGHLALYHGECRRMRIWLSSSGREAVDDIWVISGPEDEYRIDDGEDLTGALLMVSILVDQDLMVLQTHLRVQS